MQLNVGGSSASAEFATQAMLNLFDASPVPIHYVSGVIGSGTSTITSGRLHVWTGKRNLVPTIVRYAATASSDGIKKLQQPVAQTASQMTFLDHTAATNCSAPVLTARSADGRQAYLVTNCSTTVSLPVHLGASDVAGSSFHQTGPIHITVSPLDLTGITSVQAAIVPFKIVLGKAVKRIDHNSGALVNVDSLSRPEVEGLLSRQVTDWRQVGLTTDLNADGIADATAPVTLCLQQAGSGAKAALDESVIKDAAEMPIGSLSLGDPANGVYFGLGAYDIRDCIAGRPEASRVAHPNAIGYVNADFDIPDSYAVRLDGFHARDSVLGDPTIHVKCGDYYYWTTWRLNYRAADDPDISLEQDGLISGFIDKVQESASMALLPASASWVLGADMYVFKNADKGPILWKSDVVQPPCPN